MRNHFVAPEFLSGRDVVAGNIATEWGVLATAARDQNVVGDNRAAGIGHVTIGAAGRLPRDLTGSRIEGDHCIIRCHGEDFVSVEGEATLRAGVTVMDLSRAASDRGKRAPILPDAAAG